MKPLYLITITLAVIKACGPGSAPDGGPCSYDEHIYKATVADIFDADSVWKEVMFVVENAPADVSGDTIYYSRYFGSYISLQDLEKKNIRKGSAFIYIVGEIKSGSCSPTFKRLVLEPYKGEK